MEKIIENNQVVTNGKFVSPFEFSHEVFGEKFYVVDVAVERKSGAIDFLPVMISERLIDVTEDLTEIPVEITGQFRSFNRREDNKSRLVLSVFARTVEFVEKENNENTIYLDGYICKPPVYRTTPLGREITDLLIAVNRPYGKSDYIPCLCWGRNAKFASCMEVGTHVNVWGRIQSREYNKKNNENDVEKRIAYEVSVSKIEG